MIATIYVLFLIFGMASCFAAIVVAADDWLDRRHDTNSSRKYQQVPKEDK